jgi:hypothetical protein
MYMFLAPIIGGMIYLALFAPWGWEISDFAAIVPLANQVGCHALLPVSKYDPNCRMTIDTDMETVRSWTCLK